MINDHHQIFQDNIYYIHYNKLNVGSRAGNRIINFEEQKNQIKIINLKEYQELFNANIKGIELIDLATNVEEQKLVDKINKELVQKLQKDLNISQLEQLHKIVKDGNINKFLKEAVNQKNIQKFSEALEGIKKALDLLESGENSLGAILINSIQNNNSFNSIGTKLLSLLKDYEVNNNYSLIKRKSLEASKRQLENLGIVLSTGYFASSGKELSAEGLSSLLLNGLISTSIAEGLGVAIEAKAGSILSKAIFDSVGTTAVTVKNDYDKEVKIIGKTDIKANNVQLSLEALDYGDSGAGIEMNIGISSKFYTGQGFKNLNNNQNDILNISVGSGSGGSLGEALRTIFSNNSSRYLAYNYMVHEMYVKQMNNLILSRQILRLFSSAGSTEDFSQFMLINGQIISIWDILLYVINNNLQLSRSMFGSDNQGVVLTIPGRNDYINANKWVENQSPYVASWSRSRAVNSAINKVRIKAELHMGKIARGYIKS